MPLCPPPCPTFPHLPHHRWIHGCGGFMAVASPPQVDSWLLRKLARPIIVIVEHRRELAMLPLALPVRRFCDCDRRPGGDKINMVFEGKLPAALKKLPFDKHLSIQSKASACRRLLTLTCFCSMPLVRVRTLGIPMMCPGWAAHVRKPWCRTEVVGRRAPARSARSMSTLWCSYSRA